MDAVGSEAASGARFLYEVVAIVEFQGKEVCQMQAVHKLKLESVAPCIGRHNSKAAITWVISITTVVLLAWEPTKTTLLGWMPNDVELPFYTEAMSTAIVLKFKEFIGDRIRKVWEAIQQTGNAALRLFVAFSRLIPFLAQMHRREVNMHEAGLGKAPDSRLSIRGLNCFSVVVSVVLWLVPIGMVLHVLIINFSYSS